MCTVAPEAFARPESASAPAEEADMPREEAGCDSPEVWGLLSVVVGGEDRAQGDAASKEVHAAEPAPAEPGCQLNGSAAGLSWTTERPWPHWYRPEPPPLEPEKTGVLLVKGGLVAAFAPGERSPCGIAKCAAKAQEAIASRRIA